MKTVLTLYVGEGTSAMTTVLQRLIGYHAWANNDLFGTLEKLDRERFKAELQAALRLIDHYYVVAQIFAAHLTGAQQRYASVHTEPVPGLETLREAVTSSDQWYLEYVRGLSAAELAVSIPFTFTDGDRGFMTREEMLTHIVVHGGYHRGEIGRILSQTPVALPWDTFAVYLHQAEPERRLQNAKT